MFKLLLATRYLKTRYIALASIISVMLGVATMIVVNSVMSGFREEMYSRLHGILSDIVIESHGLEGIERPEQVGRQIKSVLGDQLQGMTTTVHVPAVLSFKYGEELVVRQVNLIGIDDATYASVSDFSKFLLHPANRDQLSFSLREDGYDPRIQQAGWNYRRWKAQSERLYREHRQQMEAREQTMRRDSASDAGASPDAAADVFASQPSDIQSDFLSGTPSETLAATGDLEDGEICPHCGETLQQHNDDSLADAFHPDQFVDPTRNNPALAEEGHTFDPEIEQHPGIVLGMAISNIRQRDTDGEVVDYFLCRPGDDIQLTFPSAGAPPTAVHATFTLIDFYESKMSEYDSTFAFCPLSKLQELRGMIDREAGTSAVTSIQIKLKDGSNLAAARDALKAQFPVSTYRYRIQTWMDMQGPLLAAVKWETAILNILLFLIIGVAGFGIFATFFMIVVEKTKDIGILKSLGAPSRGVMSIFISYGFALGTVGSGVGMVLGVIFVWNINEVAALIERLTGQEVFDPTVYYFQEIPTILNPWTIAWIVVGAMIIAVMASVLPALRAARMHPVEALRYE